MKCGPLLTILLLAASLSPAKEPAMVKAREQVSDLAAFTAPRGWTAGTGVAQGDPLTTLSRELHTIKMRLSGGKDSRYKSTGDFIVGFEARSSGGKPAEKLGEALIAGARVVVYRRKIPVNLPPPDASGPAAMTWEEFCTVPAGKRFFILSYSYADTVPDPDYDGSKAWRQFLKDFKLKKKPAGK